MNRLAVPLFVAFALCGAACNKEKAAAKPAPVPVNVPKRDIKLTITKEGTGEPLLEGDTLYLEYVMKSASEKFVFDENTTANELTGPLLPPFPVRLGADTTIEGLEEGLLNSKIGRECDIFIPWEKAYKEAGVAELNLPGKQDVIFTIKIIDAVRAGEEAYYDVRDEKIGSGREVKKGDRITIHYRGTYLNGKRFDNSRERGDATKGGTPFTFKVGAARVIQGLDVGVIGMKVGGTRIIKVPPVLAFGINGYGAILGDQPLLFKVELLAIE